MIFLPLISGLSFMTPFFHFDSATPHEPGHQCGLARNFFVNSLLWFFFPFSVYFFPLTSLAITEFRGDASRREGNHASVCPPPPHTDPLCSFLSLAIGERRVLFYFSVICSSDVAGVTAAAFFLRCFLLLRSCVFRSFFRRLL